MPEQDQIKVVDESVVDGREDFVNMLRFPLLDGVFGKPQSMQYYEAVHQIGKLVESVEPGQLVESNQDVWPQIRNIRSDLRKAMGESFNQAKESGRQSDWLPRAVEHANKVPVVTHYFIDDVLLTYMDLQESDMS